MRADRFGFYTEMINNNKETKVPEKVPSSRIRGLDAIRFVCAFWVVMYHNTGIGEHQHHHISGPLLSRALQAAWSLDFNGAAAVIVFFVISGFAIHFPFRHGETPAWGEYFLRRYIRIGIPAAVAVALLWNAGSLPKNLEKDVLWSLYVETIYYTAYPLLMMGKRRWGWRTLLALTSGAALLVNLHNPHSISLHGNGIILTAVLYLPAWLLGCLLAENSDALTGTQVPRIWQWRIGVWATSVLCSFVAFHSAIGMPWTMPLFSILVFFWLRQEIRRNRFKAPVPFLEKAGVWSYSLYLMHLPAFWLFYLLHISLRPAFLVTILQLAFVLALSYVYYIFVEGPSHWLARQVKERCGRKAILTVSERNQLERNQS